MKKEHSATNEISNKKRFIITIIFYANQNFNFGIEVKTT